jgi:hypothetical protein
MRNLQMVDCDIDVEKFQLQLKLTHKQYMAFCRVTDCARQGTRAAPDDLFICANIGELLYWQAECEAEAQMHEAWLVMMYGDRAEWESSQPAGDEAGKHELSLKGRIDYLLGK